MATGSFIGVGNFKGYWDATDNSGSASNLNLGEPLLASSASATAGYNAGVSPALTASVGDYWQVNVAGSTNIDSETGWALNDWVVYQSSSATGMTWNRLSVTDTIAATVIGDISESGLKNTLLASASANSGPSTPGGQSGEVLFVSASNADGTGTNKYFEGNSNFTFDPEVSLLNLTGTLRVSGEIQATQLHTNYVTSSILYDDGDTKFGDDAADQHQFTGSVYCTLGVTASTGVSSSYFMGDGSQLTGIEAGSSMGNPVYVDAAQYRVPHWGAVDGAGDFGLTGSANLSFYTTTNELQVTGNMRANDLYVGDYIYHEGDSDTYIRFQSADQIHMYAGGVASALLTSTTFRVNPGNAAGFDFGVETSNFTRGFHVDGASDNVGIRCAPSGTIQALTVSGSTLFGSASANLHEFTGSMLFGDSVYAKQDIIHWDDADTKITFTSDQIDFAAGGVTLLTLDEDGQDMVTVGDGTDVDFKVRGLGDDFAIFVEGSSDKVGVGYSSPDKKLSVSGSTLFGRPSGEGDSHWFSGSVYVSDDIHVEDKIYGLNDPNTYIDFNTDDQLEIAAGGVSKLILVESGEDYLQLGGGPGSTVAVDVRMGGMGYDNTLWVDGGSHNVGIRCAPSGTIEALTVSGSTLFGSASANTHQFTGSIMTDSSVYFGNRLINWNDDDTYIQFDDDAMSFVVGNATFISLSETANDIITFNGSGGDIDFLVKSNGATGAGAKTNLTHTIFVEGSSAKVGIAESSPGAQLDVSGSTIFGRHDGDTVSYHQVSGTLELTGNIGVNTPATTYSLSLPNVDSLVGRGMAYAWSTYSSARYKQDVATMSNPIETAKKLRGVEFTWKNSGNKDFGFIAEEVGKVLPQIVAYEDDGHTATGMDYSKITSLLIECVKSQQNQLETQEERIKYLEKKFKT